MTKHKVVIRNAVILMSCLLSVNAAAFEGEGCRSCGSESLPKPGQALRNENLSLGELVQTALGRSPDQVRLEAMNERSSALFKRADNLLSALPTLNITGRSDQWQSDEGVREYQLGIGLPMWRSGERKAGRELAETTAEWVSAEWNDIRLQMSGAVRELIWDYALAENAVESATSALEMAKKTESDMVRRVKLGELSRSDLLLAQQQTLQREEELSAAEAEHHHALIRYEVVTGTRDLPRKWREEKVAITEVSETHPGLHTLQKAVERASSEVTFLRKRRGDPVTVGLTGYHSRSDFDTSYNDSLELTVGIPFGPQSYRNVPLARVQQLVADAEAELLRQRRQLDADLREAEHGLHRVEEALVIAEKSRKLSEQQLRMAQTAFKVGESNLFTLLLVQNKTVQARRLYRETRIKRQRAIARYNQAAGVML